MPLHKGWTWLGAFGPDVMLCAAVARVGPARASWWAVWDGHGLHERFRRRPGLVDVTPLRLAVTGVLDLQMEPGAPWHAADAGSWTTKRPVAVTGSALGRPVALAGLLDQSGGRHARRTAWRWCAGAGTLRDGRRVTWNLVEGLHDGTDRSERAVWVDGVPRHVPPQPFDGLAGAGPLRFTALATRARRESYGLIASDYEQPFGVFSGSVPEAGPLRTGFGVMERHSARW